MTQTLYGGWLEGEDESRPSVRRIAKIAEFLRARSYLEIGVNRGKTFNRLNFEHKVGVDPRFHFETRNFAKDGITFHNGTSDDFFSRKHASDLFDIVFLDGLHTFTQTFKDFVNSIACGHDRTVYLIDDVMPLDYYDSLSDQGRGLRLRRSETTSNSGHWTGDVYKIMFAVHDFFPTLNYVLIADEGSEQMLVWNEGRVNYEPILGSLEAIDRLDYPDFTHLRPRLNQSSEAEAIDMIVNSFSSRYTTQYPHRRLE